MPKVLVIGDIIIDRYIYGSNNRLNPEAPVPIVSQENVIETLGGAGLVFNNLKNLGVDVELYDANLPKCVKTRIICDGHYITRIDNDIIADSNVVLNDILTKNFSSYEYVILSDYNKGVLTNIQQIIEHINKFNCKIIVDPKKHSNNYKGCWLVKPNFSEFEKYEFTNWSGNIIITKSKENVSAIIDNIHYDVPVSAVEVNDVTGAGDCFIAAFTYGLVKGYDYKKCLDLAVKGSTESVRHVGTYILKIEDIEEKIVFTNGCFDVLHLGHLKLLEESKKLGSKLVVGLNSDASVKRLKGPTRPINNQDTRKMQLEALPWVDEVIVFDEGTPYNLIKKIKPSLIVKGGDYTVDTVVGNDLAPVHIFPTLAGYSTTNIVEAAK